MKALVDHGPGERGRDTVSDPAIVDPTEEKLWIRDVTVTTGLVDTFMIPRLMKLVASGRLDPTIFATQRFALADTMSAYDTFSDAAATHALKVVLDGSDRDARSNGHIAAGLVAGAA